jgi:hypothetical protein
MFGIRHSSMAGFSTTNNNIGIDSDKGDQDTAARLLLSIFPSQSAQQGWK